MPIGVKCLPFCRVADAFENSYQFFDIVFPQDIKELAIIILDVFLYFHKGFRAESCYGNIHFAPVIFAVAPGDKAFFLEIVQGSGYPCRRNLHKIA